MFSVSIISTRTSINIWTSNIETAIILWKKIVEEWVWAYFEARNFYFQNPLFIFFYEIFLYYVA